MKKVSCPECGQELSLRGLSGHLQFKHGYNAENIKAAMIEAKKSAVDAVEGVSTEEAILGRLERMERKLSRMDKRAGDREEGEEGEGLLEDIYNMVLDIVNFDADDEEGEQTEEEVCKNRCLELVEEIDQLEHRIALVRNSESIRKDFKEELLIDLEEELAELLTEFEELQEMHVVKGRVIGEVEEEEKDSSFFF